MRLTKHAGEERRGWREESGREERGGKRVERGPHLAPSLIPDSYPVAPAFLLPPICSPSLLHSTSLLSSPPSSVVLQPLSSPIPTRARCRQPRRLSTQEAIQKVKEEAIQEPSQLCTSFVNSTAELANAYDFFEEDYPYGEQLRHVRELAEQFLDAGGEKLGVAQGMALGGLIIEMAVQIEDKEVEQSTLIACLRDVEEMQATAEVSPTKTPELNPCPRRESARHQQRHSEMSCPETFRVRTRD